jgi:hypothetical protein
MYSDQSPKGEELEKLQTTLLVSTVFPQKDSSEEFLEVATIRSPYTFDIENSQKSTRYRAASRVFLISLNKYLHITSMFAAEIMLHTDKAYFNTIISMCLTARKNLN